MKKAVAWIFAILFSVPAMALDGTISRALPSGTATATDATAPATARGNSATVSRTASRPSASTTVKDSGATTTVRASRTKTSASASRDVTPSRSVSARASGAVNSGGTADKVKAAVSTVGRNARVTAASANSDPSVRRAGISLRPSTAEVGGRAKIAGTDIQTGSNVGEAVRSLQSRAASSSSSNVTTRETIAEAKERLEQTADLNKSCQEQYNDCMDQFCAVIDSNQKRCSCSANLSHYAKVESAVKDANNQLNDVAQRIRYVGLSADEIRAIMSETEAEEALSGARDNSETRNMLADIEDLIKNPAVTSTYSSSSGTSDFSFLDMELDFSDSTNLFSLDFLKGNNNNSISNMRGAELYNAAKKRCNTIINQCKDAGATQQQLTSNYDLAIDKDCIAYEQGLTKMNETLVSNVRSANLMLQKARLAVLQNKNQYDAKECIAALEECMTDDMVCGENYEKCLDPTKMYIDENGKVVLGQDVTYIRDLMYAYDNSLVDDEFLAGAYGMQISDSTCRAIDLVQGSGENSVKTKVGNGACTVKYLLQKIGVGEKATDGGLCRPVLDKCQRYTYRDNTYQPYNDIILNYIQRAMVNIRAGQEKAISDYASSCMVDVAACYNQQVAQINTWTATASVTSIRDVMRGACRNVALTCGYAIFDGCNDNTTTAWQYVASAKSSASESRAAVRQLQSRSVLNERYKYPNTLVGGQFYPDASGFSFEDLPDLKSTRYNRVDKSNCPTTDSQFIDRISVMFYNGLLCPDNSSYVETACENSAGIGSCVNSQCECNKGYVVWNTQCLLECPDYSERNTYGSCVCKENATMKNGLCQCNEGFTMSDESGTKTCKKNET